MQTTPCRQIINSKSLARIGAVQVLYYHLLLSIPFSQQGLDDTMAFIEGYYKTFGKVKIDLELPSDIFYCANLNVELLRVLVTHAREHLIEIDALLRVHLFDQWTLDKLHPLLLSLLRCAIAELKFCHTASFKIVINEFVNIATEMLSNTGETNFVNGVLDRINKHEL